MRDLGPAITASPETLRLIMSEFGPITEEEVMDCFLTMCEERIAVDSGVEKFVTELLVANKKNLKGEELRKIYTADLSNKKGVAAAWNIDNFISYCQQTVPNFKWQNVYLQLDRPKLEFKNEEMFMNLLRILEKIRRQGGNKFKIPEQIFFKRWNNPLSQANFLIQLFRCREPEMIGLGEMQNRRIQKTVKDCLNASKQMWGYLDLVQQIIEISDWAYIEIREVLEVPMSKYPELLVLTLAEIRPVKGQAILD
jgi:hypothetical protein